MEEYWVRRIMMLRSCSDQPRILDTRTRGRLVSERRDCPIRIWARLQSEMFRNEYPRPSRFRAILLIMLTLQRFCYTMERFWNISSEHDESCMYESRSRWSTVELVLVFPRLVSDRSGASVAPLLVWSRYSDIVIQSLSLSLTGRFRPSPVVILISCSRREPRKAIFLVWWG